MDLFQTFCAWTLRRLQYRLPVVNDGRSTFLQRYVVQGSADLCGSVGWICDPFFFLFYFLLLLLLQLLLLRQNVVGLPRFLLLVEPRLYSLDVTLVRRITALVLFTPLSLGWSGMVCHRTASPYIYFLCLKLRRLHGSARKRVTHNHSRVYSRVQTAVQYYIPRALLLAETSHLRYNLNRFP